MSILYTESFGDSGTNITPAEMADKLWEAIAHRGDSEEKSRVIKSFLFFNATSIIDYLKAREQ